MFLFFYFCFFFFFFLFRCFFFFFFFQAEDGIRDLYVTGVQTCALPICELGCEYNTAWFMWHRVREAMRRGGLEPPLGSCGGIVEADETYFGQQENPQPSPQRK